MDIPVRKLADHLQRTLARTDCPPEALELEITEAILLGSGDAPLRTLQGLHALGLSIALDDFGTGYSNLAYLQRFPFRTLKIDRSFVQAADSERPLTAAIVGLCGAMGLQPVAEVNAIHQILDVASSGVAYGVLSFAAVIGALQAGRVSAARIDSPPLSRPIYLAGLLHEAPSVAQQQLGHQPRDQQHHHHQEARWQRRHQIGRRDADLDRHVVVFRHDRHDGSAGGDDAADRVNLQVVDKAVHGRANVHARQAVAGGDFAFEHGSEVVLERPTAVAGMISQSAGCFG